MADTIASPFPLPRITIRYCTQCKWLLRAAYFAQELLSTFSTSLGEVSLQPATGGIFIVEIIASASTTNGASETNLIRKTLWDRKTDGGFPETKELKRRVRDVIEPGRDLGHVDRDHGKGGGEGGKKKEGKGEEEKKGKGEEEKKVVGEGSGGGGGGGGGDAAKVAGAEGASSCGVKEECKDCE